MLKPSLCKDVKVNITIDDIRLRSNLTTDKTIRFTKKSFFFCTISGFTQSYSGPLGDIEGFIQMIPGSNKSDKHNNITGVDKVHLKCDCINGSFVNGSRGSILYSFSLSSPPGHKIYITTRFLFFKKVNKSVLSHITFYLEDDNHKPFDFKNETICLTCQLI